MDATNEYAVPYPQHGVSMTHRPLREPEIIGDCETDLFFEGAQNLFFPIWVARNSLGFWQQWEPFWNGWCGLEI